METYKFGCYMCKSNTTLETKKEWKAENGFCPICKTDAFTIWENKPTNNKEQEKEQLYPIFEKEFGRLLSPFESEQLNIWVERDGYSEELIKEALKEAVISGKMIFNYIDKILFTWEKAGVETAEGAKKFSEDFRKRQRTRHNHVQNHIKNKQEQETKEEPVLFYNWLEGE